MVTAVVAQSDFGDFSSAAQVQPLSINLGTTAKAEAPSTQPKVLDHSAEAHSAAAQSVLGKFSWNDICVLTDHQEKCQKATASANGKNPRELFKAALTFTVDSLGSAIKNSNLFKEAAADKSTKDALLVCEIVLNTAVEDLKRSINLIGGKEHNEASEIVHDLENWLSAVITNQETCIDAFTNTTGDTADKMKAILKDTQELSSNALAIAHNLGSIIATLSDKKTSSSSRRRLFSEERRELLLSNEPNAVVALDGSAQFKSINDAINSVPEGNTQPFIIQIKAGTYKEYVDIPRNKNKNKIVLIGEGAGVTIITGNKNNVNGDRTFLSATVTVNADDFMAKDLTIENTSGPEGGQAVALRVSGDRALFHSVNLDGNQDTLYTHTYRQFYRFCKISGTIDFIFGDALAIFQKCDFIVRKPKDGQGCMVTAQGRTDSRSNGAIIIQDGHFMGSKEFLETQPPIEAYFGRPWKEFARTIIMQSDVDSVIRPEGWCPWNGDFALNTLYYGEFENRGPGADLSARVKWTGFHSLTAEEAESFTPQKQYGGDQWIIDSGVPYDPGMMKL